MAVIMRSRTSGYQSGVIVRYHDYRHRIVSPAQWGGRMSDVA